MVEVLPSARPRAAAFGLKSNLTMAASTACLSPWLTLTVPLMIRDTVLAETPASRATIRRVADWRGRGPLLPGMGAEGYFDFISSSAVCLVAKNLFGPREHSFQFLKRLAFGFWSQHHHEHETGGGKQSIGEKGAGGTPHCHLGGKQQRDAGADQRVPKSDH